MKQGMFQTPQMRQEMKLAPRMLQALRFGQVPWPELRELMRAELTACLVLRPHLVRYLRGFRGFGALARTLEERVDAATLLGRVDEVLASGRKCERSGEPGFEAPE